LEELESLLSQPNIPELEGSFGSYASSDTEGTCNEKNAWLTNCSSTDTDPFFGAPHFSQSELETPKPSLRNRLVSVQELACPSNQTPNLLKIKGCLFAALTTVVVSKPNPITPNFSKKIAAKAVESKDRAKEERREYNHFLKKLCADGNVLGMCLNI
jgi:hypothetical protein